MGFFKKIKKAVKKVAPIAGAAAGAYFGMPSLGAAAGGLLGGAKGSIGNNPSAFVGGDTGGFNWGNALGLAGVANSIFNKPKMPSIPNYTAAGQRADMAARPNQNTAFGSSEWVQGPNGQWTQNVSMNPAEQAQLDSSRNIRSGLLGQAAGSLTKQLDTSGLPDASFNMDPTGNNQAVQDATYQLTARDRAQQRAAEVERLKAQGLPEDSEAFQRAMSRLDDNDRQAQFSSLLAGRQDYGQSFNRGLNQSQNNQQLRTQGINEQNQVAMSPLERMQALQSTDPKNPTFGNFASSSTALDATNSQFNANLGQYNAKAAQSAGISKGLFGLAGTKA